MSKLIAGIPEGELELAKIRIATLKVEAFDYLRRFVDGTYDTKTSGYKSIEDAAIKIISKAAKECEKIQVALEKKYPM